jgi:hypothetical protein
MPENGLWGCQLPDDYLSGSKVACLGADLAQQYARQKQFEVCGDELFGDLIVAAA